MKVTIQRVQISNSPQPIPFLTVDMCLVENTSERSNGDAAFPGYNRDVNDFSKSAYELDMATLLAGLEEAGRFKTALDLADGQQVKPLQPQPRPRSFESWVGA